MTVSWSDKRAVLGSLLLLAACRPGLAPVPPREDPANAAAPTGEWSPPPSPFEGSAFDGESLDAGGHGHAGHAGHGASPPDAAEVQDDDEHQDHQGHQEHGGQAR